MSERSRKGGDARSERQRRLADALRMNLKRRKAQLRERSGPSLGSTSEPPAERTTEGSS